MGQIKFFTSILMAGLFAFAIIMFSISFANDNNAPINLINDSDFNTIRTELQGNITEFKTDSDSVSSSYFESTVNPGDEVTESGGQFKIGFFSMMKMSGTIIKSSYKKIFGSDSGFGIFLTALTAILIYMGVMYGYKAWFGRNPD